LKNRVSPRKAATRQQISVLRGGSSRNLTDQGRTAPKTKLDENLRPVHEQLESFHGPRAARDDGRRWGLFDITASKVVQRTLSSSPLGHAWATGIIRTRRASCWREEGPVRRPHVAAGACREKRSGEGPCHARFGATEFCCPILRHSAECAAGARHRERASGAVANRLRGTLEDKRLAPRRAGARVSRTSASFALLGRRGPLGRSSPGASARILIQRRRNKLDVEAKGTRGRQGHIYLSPPRSKTASWSIGRRRPSEKTWPTTNTPPRNPRDVLHFSVRTT